MERIGDDEALYRRLVRFHINADGSVNSAAFKMRGDKPDPEISVDWSRLSTPEETLKRSGRPGLGVGSLQAGTPRTLGLSVCHRPLPDNPAHSVIIGCSTKAQCRQLADAMRLLIMPGDAEA